MNYPQIKPSLNLDFSNTKTLDPRINFRRGTPGAYYDGKTYAKAEENLIYPSIPDSNWTVNQYSIITNSTTAPDGTTTASKIVLDNGITGAYNIEKLVNVLINNFYTFSIYAKAGEFSVFNFDTQDPHFNQVNVVVDLSSGSILESGVDVIDSSITNVGNGWYRIVMVGKCILSASSKFIIRNFEDTGDGSSGFYLWGAQLEQRESVTAYTSTNGAPVTKYQPQLMFASPDQPRFDHDVLTGESKGLLIEESRTNLIRWSEQVNTDIRCYNGSLVENHLIAPDGTLTATSVMYDVGAVSGGLALINRPTAVQGDIITTSVYVKNGTYTGDLLLMSNPRDNSTGADMGVGKTVGIYFNLETGVIRDATYYSIPHMGSSITPVGNGWYRVSVTHQMPENTGEISISLYIPYDDATFNNGDGYTTLIDKPNTYFSFWGLQLEAGSFPTSYIKTSGASATRSADNASITGENFSSWYRQDEGSLYSEISSCLGSSQGGSRILTIGENTINNQIWLGDGINSTGGSLFRVYKNGAPQAQLLMNSAGSYGKFAASYKKDDFAGYFNAGNFKTDSTGEIPYVYKAKIGSQTAQEQGYLNGHIKKLSYYPQRLTNEQLQQLTK